MPVFKLTKYITSVRCTVIAVFFLVYGAKFIYVAIYDWYIVTYEMSYFHTHYTKLPLDIRHYATASHCSIIDREFEFYDFFSFLKFNEF